MATDNCLKILDDSFARANAQLGKSFIRDPNLQEAATYVNLCPNNRAGARFLLASTLAKVDNPQVDIRKPFIQAYVEANQNNAYPGRHYDERYIFDFITHHKLPCSPTTAFLTPGFRTKNIVLTLEQKLRGRPPQLYQYILEILAAIQSGQVSAQDVLAESVRILLIERNIRQSRLEKLKEGLRKDADSLPLSSEDTVNLIEQHLQCKNSARLPVLVVAAAYRSASERLGEKVLQLNPHTAADKQTGSLGDVEITLVGNDKVITTYEMKDKAVTAADIDIAIQKIAEGADVQNYIFITTERINPDVRDYAAKQYQELGGVEIAILDCLGFLRHFLHLFHRLRRSFLDVYQELVLAQPGSGVNHALKEAFLALRKAAETLE